MFWTVLHYIKSPENAGMLVRAHVALGGAAIVVVGPEPWHLKERAQAFSRRLERLCEFVRCVDDEAFFSWCADQNVAPIAVEIATPPTLLPGYSFPPRSALMIGNEGRGIPPHVLSRCRGVVTIPQHGPVACLNSAVSGVIAMYELVRDQPPTRTIVGDEYLVTEYEKKTIEPSNQRLQLPVAGANASRRG